MQFRCSSTGLFETSYTRPLRVSHNVIVKSVNLLAKDTQEPVWNLLDCLLSTNIRRPHSLPLSRALVTSGIPVGEYNGRKQIMLASSLARAIAELDQRGFITKVGLTKDKRKRKLKPIPEYLLVYLVACKVRTPQDAMELLPSVVLSNLKHVTHNLQGGTLILTALHLSRFNLVTLVENIVTNFLSLPIPPNTASLHFNLLLVALSRSPVRSDATVKIIMKVLLAMESRGLKLHAYTYRLILEDRLITVELTKYLRERMVREGVVPTVHDLEAYLKIFAKGGLIEDAAQYQAEIQKYRQSAFEGRQVKARVYTAMIGAQSDRASAFDFLKSITPPSKKAMTYSGHSRFPQLFRATPHRIVNAYDFTAAFSVASRDMQVSTKTLVTIFRSAYKSKARKGRTPFRPTVVTYTILIQGLLRRRAIRLAELYWRRLLRSGLRLNPPALAAGLKTLVQAGRPHKAFALLEQFCSRVDAASPAEYKLLHPITLSILTLNGFFHSLVRISRPDLVFRFWETMYSLYGVQQDEWTLSILIQATRVSIHLDDTFWIKFREWRQSLWHRQEERELFDTLPSKTPNRNELLASIHGLLYQDNQRTGNKPSLKSYQSPWGTRQPVLRLKIIFFQALFGAHPHLLRHSVSPISPLTRNVDPEVFHWFKVLPDLGLESPPNETISWNCPKEVLASMNHTPAFPGISPSDTNFREFMMLLALADTHTSVARPRDGGARAAEGNSLLNISTSEIPLLLLWMRKAGIRPSRRTIVLALVLWKEVNVQAPLIERFNSPPPLPTKAHPTDRWTGPGQNQYDKLVKWIEEWVVSDHNNEDVMPAENDLLFATTMIQVEKERRGEVWPLLA